MKRRDALLALPATLYAASLSSGQDASAPASAPEPPAGPSPAASTACVPVTERVVIRYREGVFDIKPPIALLLLPRPGGPPSALKWEVDIPVDHTLEINFVVDYDGEAHVLLGPDTPSMRGPFARPGNGVRGRYLARGPATFNSGKVDITRESYWKYEITVSAPGGIPVLVVDPGVIVKEGEI